MQARCYLCKYLNPNENCSKHNVSIWNLFSSCSSFSSNSTTRYLTNKQMKEIEDNEKSSLDLFKPGKILYWYKAKNEKSWHLFTNIKELKEEIGITIDELKECATYGKDFCGYIFKKTLRVRSIKKIAINGEETIYPSVQEFASTIERSTHTAYNIVKNHTREDDDNHYCFVVLDEDIAYQKR